MKSFHDGKITLHDGDCLDVLKAMPENNIDAVVTDPPYHLTSITKRFSKNGYSKSNLEQPADKNLDGIMAGSFRRLAKGFMGKQWDGGDIAFRPELWAEVLRVLKPGGHMVAFSGTRTYHRMVCAIEDAGFEIRDQLAFCFGSGFPKSHDISRNLNEVRCGCGSNRTQAKYDVQNMRKQDVPAPVHAGEGDREILHPRMSKQSVSTAGRKESSDHEGRDEPSLEGRRDLPEEARELRLSEICPLPSGSDDDGEEGRLCNGTSFGDGGAVGQAITSDGMRSSSRSRSSEQSARELGTMAVQSEPQKRGTWENCERCGKPIIPDGMGTALKPAWEPICLARKPLSESTVAANVLRWGTGALNIDGCRIASTESTIRTCGPDSEHAGQFRGTAGGIRGSDTGRWPANLCHDGSPEVLAGFPETTSGTLTPDMNVKASTGWNGGSYADRVKSEFQSNSGSAARYFYTAKADADDRLRSLHPTVKPVDLMQWLVRLVCPKGSTVLDPFAGTGTTGAASFIEGRRCVLIEREAEYLSDIEKRMGMLLSGSEERSWKLAKPEPLEALPLFALPEPAE